jgi:hypothetical protein
MVHESPRDRQLDSLYLKLFKYVVVGLMTLALLAVVVLVPMAALQFFKAPAVIEPAKAPPERSVDLEQFKNYLIQEEKRRQEQEKNGGAASGAKQPTSAPVMSSLYAEQSLAIQRCAETFRVSAQLEVANVSEKELSEAREVQRANIERLASGRFLGPSWPKAMETFVCAVLNNPAIVKLRQDKLIGSVVTPAIQFHAGAWAAIERDKAEFIAKEEARVKTEELAEVARITAARALALVYLGAAGSAFVFFMLMALYLIFAKIEDNLATINRTIQSRTLPAAA